MGCFSAVKVTDRVWWVGAVDWNLREFHGYRTARGSTYNAFLVLADKVTLTHVLLKDVILDYVTSCEKAGIVLDGKSDGRVIMED